MLEKIKAHEKKNTVNLNWLKAAVPAAAAAVLAIVFLPSAIGAPKSGDESEILVAQADYDAAVEAFAGDMITYEESGEVYIAVQSDSGNMRYFTLDPNEYVFTDDIGRLIGTVVKSDDDSYLERKVYEFPYLIADFDAAVEYNGKYRLLKECTAVYEYVTE